MLQHNLNYSSNTATHECVTAHKTMSCRENRYSINPICSRYLLSSWQPYV